MCCASNCNNKETHDPSPIKFELPINKNLVTFSIGQTKTQFLVDTGADISVCNLSWVKSVLKQNKITLEQSNIRSITGVCQNSHKCLGTITLNLTHENHIIPHKFYVFDRLHYDAILGLSFFDENQCQINFETHTLSFPHLNATLPISTTINCLGHCFSSQKVRIPARSEAILPVYVNLINPKVTHTAFLESHSSLTKLYPILGAKAVVNIINGHCSYRVMNPTSKDITIRQGTKLATATPMAAYNVTHMPDLFTSENDQSNHQPSVNTLQGNNSQSAPNTQQKATPTTTDSLDHHIVPTPNHPEATHISQSDEYYISLAKELDIDFTGSTLTTSEQHQLLLLIGRKRRAFAKDLSEIGLTDCVQHHIDVQGHPPRRFPAYRVNPDKAALIEKELNNLESCGIIERACSPWQAPLLGVAKKSDPTSIRVAINYKYLNSVVKPQFYNLPSLDSILDTVGNSGAQIFSTLDLRQGFFQIPLHPDSRDLTGFSSHIGSFRFTRMSQGLHNAPSTYQLAMGHVLRGLSGRILCCYMDDICCFSKSFSQHLLDLEVILDRLIDNNFTLNPKKCLFGRPEVHFLGHVWTKEGLKCDPAKVKAISECPKPHDKKSLKSWLGFSGYYRRFCPNYSITCNPLYKLLRKEEPFVWSEACQKAFDTINTCLVNATTLHYPSFSHSFIVSTDASLVGLGMALSQKIDGIEYPIAFASRTLKPSEKKYSITELEMLAILESLHLWNVYLSHQNFVIKTDHVSLKFIKKLKHGNNRLYRWSLILDPYHFTVEYKPGKLHCVPDHLSRIELPTEAQFKPADLDSHFEYPISAIQADNIIADETVTVADDADKASYDLHVELDTPVENESFIAAINGHLHSNNNSLSADSEEATHDISQSLPVNAVNIDDSDLGDYEAPGNIATLQRSCSDLKPMFDYLECDILPTEKRQAHSIVHNADHYVILDKTLYRINQLRVKGVARSKRYNRLLVVPKLLRREIMDSYHSLAHSGFDKCYNAIKQHYYWRHLYSDLHLYIQSCHACQISKIDTHKKKSPLQPIEVVPVLERVHIDLYGPLTTSKPEGFKYILLAIDSRSKWPEAVPLKQKDAKSVAQALYSQVFTRYGAIKVVVQDNGREFSSKIGQCLCELFKVKRVFITPHRPQANAQVERYNRTLGDSLRCLISKHQHDWPDLLPAILMNFRMTPNASTGLSPYELMFGRSPRMPIDLDLVPSDTMPTHAKQYYETLVQNIRTAEEISGINLKAAQERQKSYHDKDSRPPDFHVGQKVLKTNFAHTKGLSKKLMPKFQGPYTIIQCFDNNTYVLQDSKTFKVLKSKVNGNRLKIYHDRSDLPAHLISNTPNGNTATQGNDLPIVQPSTTTDNSQVYNTPAPPNTQPSQVDTDLTQQDPSNDLLTETSSSQPPVGPSQPSTSVDLEAVPAKIIKASRYKGKLWYYVRFDKGNNAWLLEENVANGLKQSFHSKYSLSGKVRRKVKRQRPLLRRQ